MVAIKDVTKWYDLGLQLGLPESTLDLIATHPDIEGHLQTMLSKWLRSDTEARWEKLAAENIRRQFILWEKY